MSPKEKSMEESEKFGFFSGAGAGADALFFNIMNTARDPMIILDEYFVVRAANRTFYDTFQVTQNETEGKSIFSIGNNQWDIPKLKTLLEEILPSKTNFENFSVDNDFQNIGKKYMLVNARQFLGSAPLTQKLILISIEDITSKIRAEELAAKLAAIVEFTDDAIVSEDKDGIVMTWNQGAEKVYGYSAKEMIGNSISLLLPPDLNDETLQLIKKIYNKGEVLHNFETVRKTKAGNLIDVSLSIGPMKRNDGTIYGVSKISRDITARKRLEKERDAALKAREELVGIVSHEIKNPLTAIITSLDLIKRMLPFNQGQEKIQKMLSNIYNSAHQMTRITSDLLEVTKIESGHFQIDLGRVDVTSLIEEVVSLFKPLAAEKLIHLEKNIAPEVNSIQCDRDRIVQVLSNLLTNAIKFTGESGIVRLSVDRLQDQFRFEIKDTGCGIPEAELPRVFDRFWQAKHKQYVGSGLGLYIAKNIITAHKGTIGMESTVGEGSTFYFTLPAASVAVGDLPKVA